MDLFKKTKSIRLRSHHDKYLLADADGENVIQDRNGTGRNAKWEVEILEKTDAIRLKSCYDKYLTASNVPFLFGMRGRKVLQTVPERLDSSVEWEPIKESIQFKLKTRYGQYLRANGGVPPWRNQITHDAPHGAGTQDWVLWDVDVIELRKANDPPPPMALNKEGEIYPHQQEREHQLSCLQSLPSPSGNMDDEGSSNPSQFGVGYNQELAGPSKKSEGRKIVYIVAEDTGQEERSFIFKGSRVEDLKQTLEEETGLVDIVICSRNHLNGKFYPLHLRLPPNSATLHLVVFPSSIKATLDIPKPPRGLDSEI